MLREWVKLMDWQGPVKGTAMTVLQALGQYGSGREPPAELLFPPARAGEAALTVEGPPAARLPVMHLRGTPAEMGRQHGQLLGPAVMALKRLYLDRVFHTPEARTEALAVSRRMLAATPPAFAEEVDALGRASGLGPEDALLMQSFLDVMRCVACSTVAVPADATPEGEPLLGRNLDFPGFGVAHRYNMLTVWHPRHADGSPDGHAFAAMTWPGLVGPLTAMNAPGLTLATMQALGPAQDLDAMPYILLYRQVMARCDDVPSALELLRSTRIGSSNNLMLMDAAGRAAVAELSPEGVRVRTAADRDCGGGLVSTNHFVGRPFGTDDSRSRFCALSRRLRRHRGRLSADRVRAALHAVNQGWMTLQSMVLRPASRRVEFAFGVPPATQRPMVTVDLAEHFARPAAPVAMMPKAVAVA